MKRDQFRTMVKEIIKEVITEMDTDAPPLEKDAFTPPDTDDADSPLDMTGVPTPGPKGLRKHGRMTRVLDKWRGDQLAKHGGKNPHSWPNK